MFRRAIRNATARIVHSVNSSHAGRAAGVVGFGTVGVVSLKFAFADAASDAASTATPETPTRHRVVVAPSIYDLPLGPDYPQTLPCFIEVAKGSRNKYEWDEEYGRLRLDRVLHSAVFYPHNYGFYPQTLCGDGDPLDVLVLGEELVPGCIVDVSVRHQSQTNPTRFSLNPHVALTCVARPLNVGAGGRLHDHGRRERFG